MTAQFKERVAQVVEADDPSARVTPGVAQRQTLFVKPLCPFIVALGKGDQTKCIEGFGDACALPQRPVAQQTFKEQPLCLGVVTDALGDVAELIYAAHGLALAAVPSKDVEAPLEPRAHLVVAAQPEEKPALTQTKPRQRQRSVFVLCRC